MQQTKDVGGSSWKSVEKKLGDKEALIVLPEGTGLAEAMHEFEHIKNDSGANGKLRKAVSSISLGNKSGGHPTELLKQTQLLQSGLGNKQERKRFLESLIKQRQITKKEAVNTEEVLNKKGLGKSVKNFIRGKARLAEERAATKNGVNEARKTGLLGKEDLAQQEKTLKFAGDSYEPLIKVTNLVPIRNLIQIPSRRGDFGEHVYKHLK